MTASRSGSWRTELAHVELDGNVALDGDQLAGKSGVLRLAQERFPGTFRGRHLTRPREDRLEVAELGQQFLGALFSDSLYSGNVVRGIAHQCEKIDDLPGGTPRRSVAFDSSTQASSTAAGPPRPGLSSAIPGPTSW